MAEVTLTITSPQGTREVPLAGDSLSIGRTDASTIAIPADTGLSRLHATIRRAGEHVWVVDERSTNGSFVGGAQVPPEGLTLADGDELRIGNYTTIRVHIRPRASATAATDAPHVAAASGIAGGAGESSAAPATAPAPASSSLSLAVLLPSIAVVLLLLCAVAYGLYRVTGGAKSASHTSEEIDATAQSVESSRTSATSNAQGDAGNTTGDGGSANASESDASSASSASSAATSSAAGASTSPPVASAWDAALASPPPPDASVLNSNTTTLRAETPPDAPAPAVAVKLYQKMSNEEKREFIKARAQKIAIMMGNRPYAFSSDALDEIKFWLDAFSSRIGNNRTGLWGGDTRFIFERAKVHAPVIIQAFREHRVPVVIGLYIPFIETEYTNISTNNFAGAAGLFQFLGGTAEAYGVPAGERTNVARMAPAAAKYFRDNIMRFGDDSMSVALSIAGYNRAPESVMRDLRNVLNERDNAAKERTFWTLVANKGKLDHFFQNENKNYVPRFFAAAIMGETPWAFGLQNRPLSTYTQQSAPPQVASQ